MSSEIKKRAAQIAGRAAISSLCHGPLSKQSANGQFNDLAQASAIFSRLATEAAPEIKGSAYGGAFMELRAAMEASKLGFHDMKPYIAAAAKWAADRQELDWMLSGFSGTFEFDKNSDSNFTAIFQKKSIDHLVRHQKMALSLQKTQDKKWKSIIADAASQWKRALDGAKRKTVAGFSTGELDEAACDANSIIGSSTSPETDSKAIIEALNTWSKTCMKGFAQRGAARSEALASLKLWAAAVEKAGSAGAKAARSAHADWICCGASARGSADASAALDAMETVANAAYKPQDLTPGSLFDTEEHLIAFILASAQSVDEAARACSRESLWIGQWRPRLLEAFQHSTIAVNLGNSILAAFDAEKAECGSILTEASSNMEAWSRLRAAPEASWLAERVDSNLRDGANALAIMQAESGNAKGLESLSKGLAALGVEASLEKQEPFSGEVINGAIELFRKMEADPNWWGYGSQSVKELASMLVDQRAEINAAAAKAELEEFLPPKADNQSPAKTHRHGI